MASLHPLVSPSVETVGSVYVISAGVPEPCAPGVDAAELLAVVALRVRDAVGAFSALGRPIEAKLGMHAGPIVGAGCRPSRLPIPPTSLLPPTWPLPLFADAPAGAACYNLPFLP